FTGAVALSASGAPAGVTVSFDHASLTGSGSAQMTVATTASATPGSYPLTVTGTSGSLSHSASYALTVNAQPQNNGVAFSDDAESGMTQWITYSQNPSDPQWSIEKSSASHSGTHRFR